MTPFPEFEYEMLINHEFADIAVVTYYIAATDDTSN